MSEMYVKIRNNKKYIIIRSYDDDWINLKIIEKNHNTIETIDKIFNPVEIINDSDSGDDTEIEMDY